jgi:hypothetical protein
MTVAQIAEARRQEKTAQAAPGARQARIEELKTTREAGALNRALTRAASDPKFNFTQRPEGQINENDKTITYYGWNGGKETGQWVKRIAQLTPLNLEKYGTRVPANTFAVKDLRSVPVPLKDIAGAGQAPSGFIVSPTGKIETVGNVDANILNIKSEYDTAQRKQMQITREEGALARALERAASNPLYNFMSRPQGFMDAGRIKFYGWNGGKETGQWVLYEAFNTPYNRELYETRVSAQEFYEPKSIRDVLIPKTNVLGKPQGPNVVTK